MLFHNYLYRLKCIFRDKQTMFWTLLFPIILATLFNMAFSNLSSAETFTKIKIAIVQNDEYKKNSNFIQAINSVSDENAGKKHLFDVKYTSKEEADKLLADNKIKGYIYLNNGINLTVKESGIDQTIIKSFLDDYKQDSSTITTIVSQNPSSVQNGLLENMAKRTDYIKEASAGKSTPNNVVIYFYSLIGMTCLYGSFLGLKEVTTIQGNLSSQGTRINVAPIHKFKLFIASMSAATTVQLFDMLLLMAYLTLLLKIDFGNQLVYIALTCVIGTITGVSFGTCISSIIKNSEGLKVGILIGGSMLMSFLAGMMNDEIKYLISSKAPIVGYLNPVNLITDSFYSLYYYNNHKQYFTDISILCVFAVIFSVTTYMVLRRQKYASL